ncbi:zinc chelation protein SecC [Serratia marcescens]|nr:zinc chelation protein SecC [Serratia marcescens]
MLKEIIKEAGVNSSEEKLASYADKTFLGLWAYPNVYSNEGIGKNKVGVELCDLLVVFNDYVIIFSDKDCAFNNNIDVKVAWGRWFRKSVVDSSKQLYGAEKFIRDYPGRLFLDKECTREFPFEIKKNTRFFLVAVTNNTAIGAKRFFDNVASGSYCSLLNVFPYNASECHDNPFIIGDLYPEKTFIHVLDEMTLDLIFSSLNTITDFIGYLCEKEKVVRNKMLISSGGEDATLGLYLLNDGYLIDKINGDNSGFVIHEHMWAEYEKSLKHQVHESFRKGSVFWDELIQNFSRSILSAKVGLGQENNFNSHEIVVRELASEGRKSRYSLSTAFLDKLKQVPSDRRSSRIVKSLDVEGKYYLFLFFPRDDKQDYNEYRSERVRVINLYATVAHYKYRYIKKLVIIATEPKNAQGRSEDIIAFDFFRPPSREEKELARAIMKGDSILTDFTSNSFEQGNFVGVASRTDKIKRNDKCPCGSGVKYKRCHGG